MSEAPDLFAEAMAAVAALPPPTDEPAVEASESPSEPLSEAAPIPTPPVEEKALVEQPKAPEHAPAPSPPIADERFAPRLQKLMEREAAAVAREQALKAQEAELASIRAQKAELEAAKARFLANPTDYLRKLAPELKPADLAKALWYESLGDDAPIEHRVKKTERAAQQTVEELRAEIEAERQRHSQAEEDAKMEAAHHQYVGALKSIATAVPDEYPLVKAFSSQDPERVTRGLYRMAQKHARATNGEVATPSQCAAMLQKELAGLQAALTPTAPAAPPPSKAAPGTPSSLRNAHSSVQTPKSAAMTEDEKFEAALEAARAVPSSL